MADAPGLQFQQVSTTLSRRLLDGVLLLPVGESDVLRLKTPRDALWALLEEPITLAELADVLSAVFEVSVETVLADIGPLLGELVEAGAISQSSSAS